MPVKEALEKAGWNQSALAGISDLPWSEVLEMLLPVTGRLNFGEELHLKGLMVSAAHLEGLENKKFARGSITHFKDDQWDKAYGSSAETPMTGVEKWEQLRKNQVSEEAGRASRGSFERAAGERRASQGHSATGRFVGQVQSLDAS